MIPLDGSIPTVLLIWFQAIADAIPTQPSSARERLSFELGSILTYQLRARARACEHWARHVARFEGGRYEDEVQQAEATLGCGNDGGGRER